MSTQIEHVKAFWDANPCSSKLSNNRDREAYFNEIQHKRYYLEPHIPLIANFKAFRGRDVLEIGCGIGTDAVQFARDGARYVGIDLSPASVQRSRERFRLLAIKGQFEVANAEKLPFTDDSFDHVYSFGVIHHSPDTDAIVREIYRILRPGGTFCVMVYNKSSINYYFQILFLRRLLRLLLYPRVMPALIAKMTGFEQPKLERHREIMLGKKRMSSEEWLSINTDGPDCPLSKVYGKRDVLRMFGRFDNVRTEVWHFNRLHWPIVGKSLPNNICNWLGRKWGWHRIVFGRKPTLS